MSHLRPACVAILLSAVVLVPGAAMAGVLTGATYSFSMDGGAPLVFPADGTVTGSGVSFTELSMQAGSAFSGTLTMSLDFAPATLLSVIVGSNSGASWMGDPLTGTSGVINGSSIIKGFSGVSLITVPFTAGSVGTTTISGGGIDVTVFAHGWTSGTLVIDDGAAGTLATAMGTVVTGTPGSVTLVAGSRVETSLTTEPIFHIHTLHLEFERLAPEPAGLLTLSVCGLVLALRARLRTV